MGRCSVGSVSRRLIGDLGLGDSETVRTPRDDWGLFGGCWGRVGCIGGVGLGAFIVTTPQCQVFLTPGFRIVYTFALQALPHHEFVVHVYAIKLVGALGLVP